VFYIIYKLKKRGLKMEIYGNAYIYPLYTIEDLVIERYEEPVEEQEASYDENAEIEDEVERSDEARQLAEEDY
jgi:hypothetical protein